jgi:hypothetical protein
MSSNESDTLDELIKKDQDEAETKQENEFLFRESVDIIELEWERKKAEKRIRRHLQEPTYSEETLKIIFKSLKAEWITLCPELAEQLRDHIKEFVENSK